MNLKEILKNKYGNEYASLYAPFDKEQVKIVDRLVRAKKKLNPSMLIVIGIGGSNLGTIAVYEAINGKLHNYSSDIQVFFADTVDSDKTKAILKIAEDLLKKGKNVLLNTVTKSGTTTETAALFEVFLELLKKYKKNYNEFVIIASDKNSRIWNLASEERFDALEIPRNVGGRYSVFTPVSLFPLKFFGINIDNLLKGAREGVKEGLKGKSQAKKNSLWQFSQYKKGRSIHEMFLFSTSLESLGKWNRQLIAESLGKEWNQKHTRKVNKGITPTVSIGTTDLHSIGQLDLGGPKDKFTTFVKVGKFNEKVEVPAEKSLSSLAEGIQGRSLEQIMNAIYHGVKRAFERRKIPFIEIELKRKDEYNIGKFMQERMIETIYLASLMDVNPFDQPNVEEYKEESRKLLER